MERVNIDKKRIKIIITFKVENFKLILTVSS